MIDLAFFEKDTVEAAMELIGCRLVRTFGEHRIEAVITETEAYKGGEDPASHAHRGTTERNKLMFGRAGVLYVYFSYGMHHCMNIVTEEEGVPGAVLIRGAKPVEGLEFIRRNRPGIADKQLMNGPGKLTKALAIDLFLNGYDLLQTGKRKLVLLEKETPLPFEATPRIGISKGTELPWRFVVKGTFA